MNLGFVLNLIDEVAEGQIMALEKEGGDNFGEVFSQLATFRGRLIHKLMEAQAESDKHVKEEVEKLQAELADLREQMQYNEWGDAP